MEIWKGDIVGISIMEILWAYEDIVKYVRPGKCWDNNQDGFQNQEKKMRCSIVGNTLANLPNPLLQAVSKLIWCQGGKFMAGPKNMGKSIGIASEYCWDPKETYCAYYIPSGNQTWFAGKSPIDEDLLGKITIYCYV
jgi:hypothetical protein